MCALPTFSDERDLFGDVSVEATADRFAQLGPGEVIVKNGEAAAFCKSASGSRPVEAAAVDSPVDTTGAGDSFNGAYLASRLAGLDPVEAVRKAHQVAAAVIQVRGALAPFETIRDAYSP